MIGPGSDKKWPLPYANSKSKEVIFFAKSPYYCNPKFWMLFMKLFPFVESLKNVGFKYLHLLHVFASCKCYEKYSSPSESGQQSVALRELHSYLFLN